VASGGAASDWGAGGKWRRGWRPAARPGQGLGQGRGRVRGRRSAGTGAGAAAEEARCGATGGGASGLGSRDWKGAREDEPTREKVRMFRVRSETEWRPESTCNRTDHIASSLDPTAYALAGDVAISTARTLALISYSRDYKDISLNS